MEHPINPSAINIIINNTNNIAIWVMDDNDTNTSVKLPIVQKPKTTAQHNCSIGSTEKSLKIQLKDNSKC